MRQKNLKTMFVVKRNGQQERVSFDKITSRINKLCYGLDRDFIDPVIISQKVVQVRVIRAARVPYVCALL